MGFRIGLNSAFSLDGDPYLWNFGHSPGYDSSTELSGAPAGRVLQVNGSTGIEEVPSGTVTAEPYTYESIQTFFSTSDERTANKRIGWYRYYGGDSSDEREGSTSGFQTLPQPFGFNAEGELDSFFDSPGTREMVHFWEGPSLLGGAGAPAVTVKTKYGYSLDAKSGVLVVGQPYYSTLGSGEDGRMYVYDMNNTFLGTLRNSTIDGTSIKSSVTSIVKSGSFGVPGTTSTINMSSSANMPSIGQLVLFGGIFNPQGPASSTDMISGVFKVTGTPTSTSFTVEHPPQVYGTITSFPAASDIRIIFTNNADLGVGGSSIFLGSSVAISDNGIIACGAESSPSTTPHSGGAVLIYLRGLLSANTAIPTSPYRVIGTGVDLQYKRFGSSVAIIRANSFGSSQNKLYVGSPGWFSNTGIVNVYNLDSISELGANTIPNEHGNQRVAQITPASVGYTGPASRFGETVAAGEGMIAISAPEYAENGITTGAVFLVRASDHSLVKKITPPIVSLSSIFYTNPSIVNYVGTGNTTVTLTVASGIQMPLDAQPIDAGSRIKISGAFGTELSKLNGTWPITSYTPNAGGFPPSIIRFTIDQNFTGTFAPLTSNVGMCYLIKKSAVDNVDGNYSNQFGFSIAISSGRIVIGDPFVGNSFGKGGKGQYYIYDTSGNLINYSTLINPSVMGDDSGTGACVAIGNGKIFIGAPNHRAVHGPYPGDTAWERSVRTGMMRVTTLDGRIINHGHKVYETSGFDDPTAGYESDYPFNNNNDDVATPYSGFGWACAFYNDTLYVTKLGGVGVSQFTTPSSPDLTVYKNITRTYTVYDAIQLQKGVK